MITSANGVAKMHKKVFRWTFSLIPTSWVNPTSNDIHLNLFKATKWWGTRRPRARTRGPYVAGTCGDFTMNDWVTRRETDQPDLRCSPAYKPTNVERTNISSYYFTWWTLITAHIQTVRYINSIRNFALFTFYFRVGRRSACNYAHIEFQNEYSLSVVDFN